MLREWLNMYYGFSANATDFYLWLEPAMKLIHKIRDGLD